MSGADVVVVGDTLCGWMAAAALARRLPRDRYRVTVVGTGSDGDGLGDFAEVIAVPPVLAGLHAELGLHEAALVAGAGGGWSLGTAFSGWRADGGAAFLPYGETGASLNGIAFRHIVGRLRSAGQTVRMADHSVAALAAQAGRFAPDAPLPRSLHLPVAAYTAALRRAAEALGARAGAALTDLVVDNGIIAEVRLADGSAIAPLLVLDCSGANAVAASRLDDGFADWSAWLPCDRVDSGVAPADAPPFAQVEALDDGWLMILPLDNKVARIACRAGGPGRRFRQGGRTAPWVGNCVALGAAASVLEPLHPTALTLLLRALARLIQLWPADRRSPVEAAAFNRAAVGEQDRARDFVIAHYHATGRPGAWWAARRDTAPPEPVEAKLDLFAARGRLPMGDDEVFEEEDWATMLDAMGMIPRRHDALADLVPLPAAQQHLAGQRAGVIAAVRGIPPYPPRAQGARA